MSQIPGKKIAFFGGVVLFCLAALEVVIMISPFAFFFYSVFNPIFHFLSQSNYTKWLTRFFLPHMILPPTLFLQGVRVLGSIFFVLGLGIFVICALQVYLGKIFKWGIASRGLYRYIRHPQYFALGLWGIGMAILWPRFIVLLTLALMFILYYFLAKDEERRMVAKYGGSYEEYLAATGMFVPPGSRAATFTPDKPPGSDTPHEISYYSPGNFLHRHRHRFPLTGNHLTFPTIIFGEQYYRGSHFAGRQWHW